MANHIMYEIGGEPTRLTPNGSHSGLDITIQNQGPATIYLGVDDTLSSGNYGYKLGIDQAFSVELPGHEALYAIADFPGAVISTMQISLEQGA
jgi:hypothetical protein